MIMISINSLPHTPLLDLPDTHQYVLTHYSENHSMYSHTFAQVDGVSKKKRARDEMM